MDTRANSTDPRPQDLPVVAIDVPILYEDDGQEEMGETDLHYEAIAILRYGLKSHLADHPEYRVFSDLNLYYHRLDHFAYVSPDNMVVVPFKDLGEVVTSYKLDVDGPAPVLTTEVLSRRSHQQQDTTNKLDIYSDMGVREYILVDPSGEFLEQRLLLKKLQRDKSWREEQDADGGVTSELGFRVVVEPDGTLAVLDATSGRRYARPSEASQHQQAREQAEQQLQQADERIRALEAELARLRQQGSDETSE